MKEIILGIKDYIKDCQHDWLVRQIKKYYFLVESKDETDGYWYPLHSWKEGNVWHYIRQRRIAKTIKNRRCAG